MWFAKPRWFYEFIFLWYTYSNHLILQSKFSHFLDKKTHEIHKNLNPTKITNHTDTYVHMCFYVTWYREPLPGHWDDDLDSFQKLLVLRCLRADKVTNAMQVWLLQYNKYIRICSYMSNNYIAIYTLPLFVCVWLFVIDLNVRSKY